jgi:hypothetical protein
MNKLVCKLNMVINFISDLKFGYEFESNQPATYPYEQHTCTTHSENMHDKGGSSSALGESRTWKD